MLNHKKQFLKVFIILNPIIKPHGYKPDLSRKFIYYKSLLKRMEKYENNINKVKDESPGNNILLMTNRHRVS